MTSAAELARRSAGPWPGQSELLANARRRFQRGERIDISSLAAELGISRATAYRRVGNNEVLMADVLCSLTVDAFRRSEQEAAGVGRERVLWVFHHFLHRIADSVPFARFLERDPELALTLVASRAYPVQRTVISLVQDLLETEAANGCLWLPMDAHTLAYGIVRTFESFLYRDIVTGEKPDIDDALAVIGLLLPDGAPATRTAP